MLFFQRYSKILFSFSLIIGLIFLSGCGGSYANRRPYINQKTLVQPDQGLVVARIVNTSAYPLPFNILTITPENLNTSKAIKPDELEALKPYPDQTTVFASVIAPGTYALKDITALHYRGDYRYSKFVFTDAKLGTFEVKPGHITDLGTILYYPKPQTDRYLDILTRVPDTANGEVVKKYFPFYNYQADKLLTWKEDGSEDERETLFASIAQNPVNFDKHYQSPDHSIYFLARLGVIVKRDAEGEWSLDAVNTNLKLNSIAQNQRGDLIVGGIEGRLFFKPAGKNWQDISRSTRHSVAEVKFYDENTIDLLVNEGTRAVVYRATLGEQPLNWQALNEYSYTAGWKNYAEADNTNLKAKRKNRKPHRISLLATRQLGDQTYIDISTQSVSDDGAFPDYDFDTFAYSADTWQTFEAKETGDMRAILKSGAVDIGIEKVGFWDWDGRPSYFRLDAASGQWIEISTGILHCGDLVATSKKTCGVGKKTTRPQKKGFHFLSLPFFKSELEAIAIVNLSDFDFWSGERTSKVSILKTTDGGETWLDTGNKLPFDFCGSLVREVTDRMLLSCDGVSGDFYESFDDGATWDMVRQHENF